MNLSGFIALRDEVTDALRDRNLLNALLRLESLAVLAGQPSCVEAVSVLRRDYTMLLDYMKRGIYDNSRESYYYKFLRKAYAICDSIDRLYLLENTDSPASHAWRRINQPAESVAEVYLPFVEGCEGRPATIGEILKDPLASYHQLFDTVWASPMWSEEERLTVYSYVMNDNAPDINRLTLVGAVGVALLFSFDEQKFLLLLSVIEEHEVEVSIRALIFALLAYAVYKDRIDLYPTIMLKFNFLSELTCFHPLVLSVQKALVNVMKSPEESKSFDMGMHAELAGLADMEQAIKEIPADSSQEEIHEYFEDNPSLQAFRDNMFNKVKDYAKLISQGIDMNYHAFAHMRSSQPFFDDAANWFCPFSLDHPLLYNIDEIGSFIAVLLKNRTCDTDRYAVAFSVSSANADVRIVRKDAETLDEEEVGKEDMEEFMKTIRDEMEEAEKRITAEGLMSLPSGVIYHMVVSYVQDCFRFYTLYNGLSADDNPFECSLSFWKDPLFKNIFATDEEVRELANCVFSLQDYDDALELYLRLELDAELHRRVAFCYDKLNEHSLAQLHYRVALELEPDAWTEEMLLESYRISQNYSEAINLLSDMLNSCPKDFRKNRQLGEMYLREGLYAEALSVFTKLDYLRPDHLPTLRALAWCHMNLSDFDRAAQIYLKIVGNSTSDADDLFNAGHCALIQNDFASAVAYYQEYLRLHDKKFASSDFFGSDIAMLRSHKVSEVTMKLMIDQLNL